MRRLLMFSSILLCVALVVSGCAGAKQAATPAAQAVLTADRALHQLSVDYLATADVYAKGCNPAARSIDVATCNAWDTFGNAFRARYRQAGNAVEAVRTSGQGQADADAAIAKLRADLAPFKR